MLYFLYVATCLAMIWVVVTLIVGASSMVKEGEAGRKSSNKWMTRRIWAQVTAFGLLFLTVYVRNQSGG